MPLTARKFLTVFPAPSQNGIITLGQLSHYLICSSPFSRFFNALLIIQIFDLPKANIFPHAELVAHVVLEDYPKPLMQGFQIVFTQVDTIQQDLPLSRVIKPGEQLDQRGFTGTV